MSQNNTNDTDPADNNVNKTDVNETVSIDSSKDAICDSGGHCNQINCVVPETVVNLINIFIIKSCLTHL